MANQRYTPIATDDNESFSLKDIPNSGITPSYFSGTPTSAPPSFHSRSNSLNANDFDQLHSFIASTQESTNVNHTPSTTTARTTSSTITNQNEIIASLLARIQKLEQEVKAKRNGDGDESETEHEDDVENMALSPPRRRQREDRCCNEGMVAIIFSALTLIVLIMAWVLIEYFKAWGKRGSVKCG